MRDCSRDDLLRLRQNSFTAWKGQHHLRHWYDETETLNLRQQLGEISSAECSELNRVFSGTSFAVYSNEPANLQCVNLVSACAVSVMGIAVGGYGKFVMKYGNTWLLSALIPGAIYCTFSHRLNTDKT